ncbi:MAG TPA: gluconate 2-dehydrogenase subunit 3 family protein [Verrucomicrobiae bacterium]|nr:gluconate 2-dehydrogenase subunit 3 family protein [Verrucomicrobiae bacterium]
MEVTRRNLIQILSAAAPAAATAQAQERAHTPAPPARPAIAYQRKVFDDHQWKAVRVLCDLILPADDRSVSATAAGVPEFIDDWLDFRRHEDGSDILAAQIQGGLAWLDAESRRLFQKDFADAAEAQQKQILDRIAWPAKAAPEDRRWVAFFNRFRDLTVSGFYSSKVGIADLPYLGNKAVAEWKGCDPKVWAVIEERMKNGYKGLGGEVKPW